MLAYVEASGPQAVRVDLLTDTDLPDHPVEVFRSIEVFLKCHEHQNNVLRAPP